MSASGGISPYTPLCRIRRSLPDWNTAARRPLTGMCALSASRAWTPAPAAVLMYPQRAVWGRSRCFPCRSTRAVCGCPSCAACGRWKRKISFWMKTAPSARPFPPKAASWPPQFAARCRSGTNCAIAANSWGCRCFLPGRRRWVGSLCAWWRLICWPRGSCARRRGFWRRAGATA